VHDPLLVRRGETLGDLDRIVDRLARRDGTAGQSRPQRLALEQLRDDVRRAVVRPEVVNRRDIRVIEDARGARLLLEALQAVRLLRVRRRQDLDRDFAAEARILRAVDLSHAARAQRRSNLVWSEPGAGGESHRFGADSTGDVTESLRPDTGSTGCGS